MAATWTNGLPSRDHFVYDCSSSERALSKIKRGNNPSVNSPPPQKNYATIQYDISLYRILFCIIREKLMMTMMIDSNSASRFSSTSSVRLAKDRHNESTFEEPSVFCNLTISAFLLQTEPISTAFQEPYQLVYSQMISLSYPPLNILILISFDS